MMLRTKIILSILLLSFLVMSSVSAADNLTEDIISIDNSYDVNVVESIYNESQVSVSNSKSFSDLNILINNNSAINIYLYDDLKTIDDINEILD